jgi:hypothetical protein
LRLVIPAVLLLGATVGGMATINRAITGDAWTFPHQLYDRERGEQPVFLWQPIDDLAASRSAKAAAAREEAGDGWRAPRTSGWHRLAVTLYFFVGLPGVLVLLLTPAAIRDGWSRFAALVFLLVAAGHFLIYPWWAHYSAPTLAALLVPTIGGHRALYAAKRAGGRIGPALFAAAFATQLAVFLIQIPSQRADANDPSRQRARLAWEFEHRAGKHLLVVTYPPGWSGDWTFNPADIDAAKVVWASDLGAERNQELLRYYSDRTVWSIDARFDDQDPVPKLIRPAVGGQ